MRGACSSREVAAGPPGHFEVVGRARNEDATGPASISDAPPPMQGPCPLCYAPGIIGCAPQRALAASPVHGPRPPEGARRAGISSQSQPNGHKTRSVVLCCCRMATCGGGFVIPQVGNRNRKEES